jgi:hypothetical protein
MLVAQLEPSYFSFIVLFLVWHDTSMTASDLNTGILVHCRHWIVHSFVWEFPSLNEVGLSQKVWLVQGIWLATFRQCATIVRIKVEMNHVQNGCENNPSCIKMNQGWMDYTDRRRTRVQPSAFPSLTGSLSTIPVLGHIRDDRMDVLLS